MIKAVLNERVGKKVRVRCNKRGRHHRRPQGACGCTAGTRPDKIRIPKWYTIYKDHITLKDYGMIHDGMGLDLYYN